ncbi:unnamed protein product [Bathycoccus prasinos]
MQANDDNENEDGAVEGLVDLGAANPYQGAPIHREEQFRNSNLVNSEKFDKCSLWEPFGTSKAAYATLEQESFVKNFVLWGDTFEFESFFYILKKLAKNKAKKLSPAKITKHRKSRSKVESPEDKLLNDGIILQKNVLDKELHEWAMNPWHNIKVKYANVCPRESLY